MLRRLAGFIATRLFGSRGSGLDGFTNWSLLVAVVGACAVLGVSGSFRGGRRA